MLMLIVSKMRIQMCRRCKQLRMEGRQHRKEQGGHDNWSETVVKGIRRGIFKHNHNAFTWNPFDCVKPRTLVFPSNAENACTRHGDNVQDCIVQYMR